MSLRYLVGLAFIAGCTQTSDFSISPMDGLTAVSPDEPLVAYGAAREIPPGYPLGDLITVVDLADGGYVDGEVMVEGTDLSFYPAQNWSGDRRYAWTVGEDEHVTHGPELPIPEESRGTAVFSRIGRPEALGAWSEDPDVCVLLSQPEVALNVRDLRLTVNDVAVESFNLHEVALGVDAPVTGVCISATLPIGAGSTLRVWWGNEGPWRFNAEDTSSDALIQRLTRQPL